MRENKLSQIFAIIFSCIMILLLLFPAFYAGSISLQDEFSIYNSKPQFIPSKGKNVVINLDYSALNDTNNIEDILLQDTTVAMFSTYREQIKDGITAIEIYGVKDGATIFYSRAHTSLLALEKDYGVYRKTNPIQKVLLKSDSYNRFMQNIGYEFNLNGISKTADKIIHNEANDDLVNKIFKNYDKKYSTNGSISKILINDSITQLFEKYIYYFNLPKYMFSSAENIHKYGVFAFTFNTVLTTVWAILCQIIIPALTAYPLANLFKKKTSDRLLMVFLITMMIPFASIMVPQLVLMQSMGMYDNYLAMLFPWLLPSPFYIMLYKSFFQQIPSSLFEAARIDGAGEMLIFTRICMPLSKAIISLIAIQAFISGWCDFFWYYMATKNVALWTLNVAIFNISNSSVIKQNYLMGLSVATMVPIFIIVFLFSKQLKNEVLSSAVKG